VTDPPTAMEYHLKRTVFLKYERNVPCPKLLLTETITDHPQNTHDCKWSMNHMLINTGIQQ
jgi:hypothetical protein